MPGYAFYLDASACSGCKACQVACKDKHALPLGVLWRRVYEVSGGGWQAEGEAWRQDVFAYNLSISCNNCERPICVEVCPTRAMHRRADGIVLIDQARCVGCRYCEWACPYGAPQFDPGRGVMGKCTLCEDELELGLPPACVAACGLRALDFGSPAELAARYASPAVSSAAASLAPVAAPLPDPRLTDPGLLLGAHPASARIGVSGTRVANLEEVSPGRPPRLREPSLVAFTLLLQLAVGLFWVWLALRWRDPSGIDPTARLPLFAAVPLALAGVLASLLHLGQPRRAWRAVANLRTSWLSREILLGLAFLGGGALVAALEVEQRAPTVGRAALGSAVGALGLALVYAMARVYRLRTVPAWDTVRTFRSFLLTALLLGALAGAALLALAGGRFVRALLLAALFTAAAAAAVVLRARFFARHARAGGL